MSERDKFSAIIVAGGSGNRARLGIPKQYAPWRGRPLLAHSLAAFQRAGAEHIMVVVPDVDDERAKAIAAPYAGVRLVNGGATRRLSALAGLESLTMYAPESVLIHDAARPILPQEVIARLLLALGEHSGAIPVLPIVDSLLVEADGYMAGAADRDALRRVQTPQAFRFPEILAAHLQWAGGQEAGDDAQVAMAAGLSIALVEGDERLKKITFAEDFIAPAPPIRVGTGYDVHRLAAGEELWLGGIKIAHDKGLSGHSDADVALHAITDAILGAVAAGDIGQHFPPSDAKWKGASSDKFLAHACALASEKGYSIGNIDLTIICEAPKIGPHREAMVARIADICGIDASLVSVKATTTERLGYTGREEGIAAQAAATLLYNGA